MFEDIEAFRREVRAFIAGALPDDIRDRTRRGYWFFTREDCQAWQRILDDQGWGAWCWPAEHGGAGWSPLRQHVFEEECGLANCPRAQFIGLKLAAPVIYSFGSQEQKSRYLPGIRGGTDWWCQGYSEPGAGSDLAGIRTRAVRSGDSYVVSGQKIWTSRAHVADYMLCLLRTGPASEDRRDGLSFLIIDMKSPGITIRPIVSIERHHHLNEVFLDEVVVPAENLVGAEGQGWNYSKALLKNERTGIAELGKSRERLERLKDLARSETFRRTSGELRARIARAEVRLLAAEALNLRILASRDEDERALLASVLKNSGAELAQELGRLLVEALGREALRYDIHAVTEAYAVGPHGSATCGLVAEHVYQRSLTIAAGSTEIQKGIIARTALGA